MDKTTMSKIELAKDRKDGTVLVVSGNKTWYTHIGNLPLVEKGNSIKEIIKHHENEKERLYELVHKLEDDLKTTKEILSKVIKKLKESKEDIGL